MANSDIFMSDDEYEIIVNDKYEITEDREKMLKNGYFENMPKDSCWRLLSAVRSGDNTVSKIFKSINKHVDNSNSDFITQEAFSICLMFLDQELEAIKIIKK
jgi:hypothetical protein